MWILAASDAEILRRGAVWGGLAILGLIAFVVVVHFLRKRLYSSDGHRSDAEGFDLDTLERMREDGTLSDGEYRALRAQAVQALRGKADLDA